MIQAIALVIVTVALGMVLAHGIHVAQLFKQRLELEERQVLAQEAIAIIGAMTLEMVQELKRQK